LKQVERIEITLHYNDGAWCSETSDKRFGMTLESGSLDALIERVKVATQDMLETDFHYTGDIQFVFRMAERVDNLKSRMSA